MSASRYVGRVGGLAVALGLGAAVFSGGGVAWADRGDSGADRGGSAAGSSAGGDSSSDAPSRGHRGAPATTVDTASDAGGGAVRGPRAAQPDPVLSAPEAPESSAPSGSNSVPAAAAAVEVAPAVAAPVESAASAAPVAAEPEPVAVTVPDVVVDAAAPAAEAAVATAPEAPAVQTIVAAPVQNEAAAAETTASAASAAVTESEPEAAPAGEVSGYLSAADDDVTDGAGTDPLESTDSPLSWALVAAARRQTVGAAASTTAPAAQVTSSQQASNSGLTVDPTVALVDGILVADLNATSERGLELRYTPVGGTTNGSNGGKLTMSTTDPGTLSLLPYRTWDNAGAGKTEETWKVRVSEVTDFDKFLVSIPLVGMIAEPVINLLQQLPLISTLLAPLIGASVVATVTANVNTLAPGETPVAYTYKVTSFDGVGISANWFPAVGLAVGDTAPTVLSGPGLASPGQTDPYAQCGICGSDPAQTAETLGVGALREHGYNVVTWDPRGEFDSGGILQLDNPFFEGRDVSALIDYVAADTPAALNGPGDPKVGMVGGSYGGGIQLTAASIDSRIDAIVPDIAWHSLNESLYPDGNFKTIMTNLLAFALVETKARINNQIYLAIATGDLLGFITKTAQAVLSSSGPTALLSQLTSPTLLTQGFVDVLFPLNQSLENADAILATGTTAKVIWFCGGHGVCSYPINEDQASTLRNSALAWLDQYVAGNGTPADAIPNFQWFDQLGDHYTSNVLPTDPSFNDLPPVTASSNGGHLLIAPLIGGSGPGVGGLPYSLAGGSPARNAINIDLFVPGVTQVVGAPTLSFTYKGIGNARAVYAQVIDTATGQVLGNIVTPVSVTLDGKEHEVSVDLSSIVYTNDGLLGAGTLKLQITSSATAYANNKIGFINISDVEVTLPNRTTPS